MDLDYVSAANYGVDESVAVLNAGSAHYFVPIRFDRAGFLAMTAQEDLDLRASCVALSGGRVLAIGHPAMMPT